MITELVCTAVAVGLYLNTLDADFCYDDSRAIKTNQDLLPETPWTNILYDDFWGTLLTHSGSHKSFRPLCTLSFRLNYTLHGLRPWGYHLLNVVLHGLVTALFTAFSRPLLGGGLWSLLAGLLFASHPVHTEAVAGVVGRADVGAALFFLLSLLCYVRHCGLRRDSHGAFETRRCGSGSVTWCWGWMLGCLWCAAASMLWKEQGVTVLAVSAIYDLFVFQRLRFRQALLLLLGKKKNISVLLSLGMLASWGVLLLSARLYWMGNKPPNFSNSDNPAADSPHFLTRTLTFLHLPAANAWLLLCPDKLSFDWSMDAVPLVRSLADWRNLHTVAFYGGFIFLALFGLRGHTSKAKETNGKAHVTNGKSITNGNGFHAPDTNHNTDQGPPKTTLNGSAGLHHCPPRTSLPPTENLVLFSLSILSMPFIPATNLFFYVGFVIAERVLYIPSIGFCLLVAAGARTLYVRLRTRGCKALLLCLCMGLVLLNGLRTVQRNRDWSDEENLYKSGISVNPAKAWGNLGNVLKNQGKMAEAEKAYRNALHYRGNMADMLYNLGLLLQENERPAEALHYYKLAIGSRPTLASAYLNTGIILMNQGNLEEAKRTFLTCADIPDENLKDPHAHKSSVTSCLYNLGKLLHEQGQQEEALSVYKEAVQKMPRQFAPHSLFNMMGEAYMRLNRLEEAGHWYRESLRAKPDHIPAHLTYGKLLSIIGQKTEAEKYFLRAVQLDPTKGNCYMHYGQFLLEQSRLGEAAEMAERAAELDSSEFDVVFSAAHMLRQASLNEAAEKQYERAASLRPDYPAALMNLGAILHLNGKLPEAEANYLRALQLKPDDVITQSNLRKLWNIMERQGLRTKHGLGTHKSDL
ncbi:transmembrane and TPR repeat-containing protein 2-like isoform X1 [Seriola lalandi dorsalis]|uniref:transmembrane and TPR repeat-containing protein 2-like isoform X1 n=1 Tax=Seriola lalandi dorsalis TaxID=1841481 RepID=UPI000C6F7FDE|nr:transmembrane and TPR repeat-containing protein 2-like isoform X1 [Seriola lalandi dorsalis]